MKYLCELNFQMIKNGWMTVFSFNYIALLASICCRPMYILWAKICCRGNWSAYRMAYSDTFRLSFESYISADNRPNCNVQHIDRTVHAWINIRVAAVNIVQWTISNGPWLAPTWSMFVYFLRQSFVSFHHLIHLDTPLPYKYWYKIQHGLHLKSNSRMWSYLERLSVQILHQCSLFCLPFPYCLGNCTCQKDEAFIDFICVLCNRNQDFPFLFLYLPGFVIHTKVNFMAMNTIFDPCKLSKKKSGK